MNSCTDIDLLLIGKTGNGKSALGNAILKRKVFVSRADVGSVTTSISYEVSEYKGKIIKVVDGPGVGDTRLNTSSSARLVVQAMEHAIALNTRGYHAFLLVVRFGCRFTVEDQDVVQFLKNVFGADFVRRFCILVMTCGDNFDIEAEDTGITFEQWRSEQEGVFQELMRECGNRVVLFDNVTRDEAKRNAQIDELLRVVRGLQAHGYRYTDSNFERAQSARQRAMVEAKMPVVREEIFQETSLILQKLEDVKQDIHSEKQIPLLQHLLSRCDSLIDGLHAEDRGTGALQELGKCVSAVRRSVEETVQVHAILVEERRRREVREREWRMKQDRQFQQEQQHYNNMLEKQQQAYAQARQADVNRAAQQQQQAQSVHTAWVNTEQALVDQLDSQQQQVQQQSQQLRHVYNQTRNQSDQSWLGRVVGFIRWLFGYES